MLALARDHAQGAHPFAMPPEHTHLARDTLGPGRLLAPGQGVLLEQDPDLARPLLRAEAAAQLGNQEYRDTLVNLGWSEDDLVDGGSDALIDRLFAWGSVSDITARVKEHLEAGADHVALFVLRGSGGGPPVAEWRELSALL
jgi:probable F420-dependent oxidoreductase